MQFSPAVVLAVSRAPYPKQLIHYQLLVLLSEKLRNPSSTWCLSSGKSTCMRISSAYFLSLKLSSFMSDKALLKLLFFSSYPLQLPCTQRESHSTCRKLGTCFHALPSPPEISLAL